MAEYSQGVCGDGAAILRDGQRMTVDEIVAELNGLYRAMDRFVVASALYHTSPHDTVAIRAYAKARRVAVDLIGEDDDE